MSFWPMSCAIVGPEGVGDGVVRGDGVGGGVAGSVGSGLEGEGSADDDDEGVAAVSDDEGPGRVSIGVAVGGAVAQPARSRATRSGRNRRPIARLTVRLPRSLRSAAA
jgi:hypothetical protein